MRGVSTIVCQLPVAVRTSLVILSVFGLQFWTMSDVVLALDADGAAVRAIEADPKVRGAEIQILEAEGALVQAGKRPNPELGVDIENALGTGRFREFESAEFTFSLSQKFELGDKRVARISAASGQIDVAAAETEVLRREVIVRAKTDFLSVLGATAQAATLQSSLQRIQRLLPALKKRVEAGASPATDLLRGELAAGRAEIALEKGRLTIKAAKQKLVGNWLGRLEDARSIEGGLPRSVPAIKPLDELTKVLDQHPAVVKWNAVAAQRWGELTVQRSQAIPDVTLGAGVRRLNESDDTALVFHGSVPLPIFDRNEGNIAQAQAKVSRTEHEREAALLDLTRELSENYGALESACQQAQLADTKLVPLAQKSLGEIEQGYELGRFTVLDLLDASNSLAEARSQQIEALVVCFETAGKIRALTGLSAFAGLQAKGLRR